MSLITLQSIETTAGALFLKAVTEVKKIETGVATVLDDVVKAEPIINNLIAMFAPQYKLPAEAAEAVLNFFDAEVQKALAAGPITADSATSIPATLMTAWLTARAKILTFENTI